MARLGTPQRQEAVAKALHAAYVRHAEDWRRDHLGASILGHQCDRYVWLSHRWALAPNHDGRMLRLFERGKREELWIIDDLLIAGILVEDKNPATGEQWSFRIGHVGGSLDGIVSGGPLPPGRHVLEVKTHNAKSFGKLVKSGVRTAKPQHWAQMQVYMFAMDLPSAVYVAVCKDNDELHIELVPKDEPAGFELVRKANEIAFLPTPPERAAAGKDFPPCVYVTSEFKVLRCQFYGLCHGKEWPATNCRTCIDARPTMVGWSCSHHGHDYMDGEWQRGACPSHLALPAMVNAQVTSVDAAARRVEFQFADGEVKTSEVPRV